MVAFLKPVVPYGNLGAGGAGVGGQKGSKELGCVFSGTAAGQPLRFLFAAGPAMGWPLACRLPTVVRES